MMVSSRDLAHWHGNLLVTDRPDFDLEKYARNAPSVQDFNLKEKLQQWREDGIVVFPSCVDDGLIDLFLEDILYLDKHPSEFDLEVEFRGDRLRLGEMQIPPLSDTGIKFNCLENISLAARHLSLNRLVCEFLSHVFQDAPAVLQSLTFWRGSEQSPHLDYPYVRTQTRLPHLAASWIPLEDVHPDSGPLAYYPGSHQQGLIPPFDWGDGSLVFETTSARTPTEFSTYLAERIERLGLKGQIFLPRRGDVLIWHGNLLHEGTRVNDKTRTRRSYVTHYTSLEAYPPEHMRPNALAMGAFLKKNGGYVFEHPWVSDDRQLASWRLLV